MRAESAVNVLKILFDKILKYFKSSRGDWKYLLGRIEL